MLISFQHFGVQKSERILRKRLRDSYLVQKINSVTIYDTVINTDLQREKSKWINKIALKVAQSKVDLNNFQD